MFIKNVLQPISEDRASRKSGGVARRFLKAVLGLVIVIALVTVAVVGVPNLITVLGNRDNVHTVSDAVAASGDDVDAIIVLGASVKPDGTPSDMLRDRLDTAAALYKEGAAPAIIVSGDNRTSHYNETDAMKKYLIGLGVPSAAIYEDHAGYSTFESMYRAAHVFDCDKVIVTTQAYHLYRAMQDGKAQGMDVYGVASDHGSYENQTQYSIREVLARVKDFFAGLVGASSGEDGPFMQEGEHVDLGASGDLT